MYGCLAGTNYENTAGFPQRTAAGKKQKNNKKKNLGHDFKVSYFR